MTDSDGLNEWEWLDLNRTSGYRVMRARRESAREALLDSFSQPPDESELYGDALVIEGGRVGEEFDPDYFDGDVVAIPGHTEFGYQPGDKTLVEAWHTRSKQEQAVLTKRQQEELREIEREERRVVWRALEKMDERDRHAGNARAKYLRLAHGTHNLHGRKLKWPFGPPIRSYRGWEKHSIYIAPEPEGWVEPEWPPTPAERWAAQGRAMAAQAEADERAWEEEQKRNPPPPPIVVSWQGIDHVVPRSTYESYRAEAKHRGIHDEVSQNNWVLYRLGLW